MLRTSMNADEIRNLYMQPYRNDREATDRRIREGIETHRKGDFRLRVVDKDGRPVKGATVSVNQTGHAFRCGANIFMLDGFESEEMNQEFRLLFRLHFNHATLPFYWKDNEPSEGYHRFEKNSPRIYRRPPTDLCMEYCEENGITPKLHCLVYDEWAPDWTKELPLPALKAKYEKRFREIAERYGDRLLEVEVINEVLRFRNWETGKYPLSETPDVIEWAFGLARQYFPCLPLLINEAAMLTWVENTEFPYYQLIREHLDRGLPIQKIVMQNHQFTGVGCHTTEEFDANIRGDASVSDPARIFRGLDIMASLGLPLQIGEVTIPTFGEGDDYEELQADMLRLWYSIWFSHPAVDAITYWNTPDGYAHTFHDNWVENRCRGGLFHHDLTPKKSARTLKKLFSEEWHTEGAFQTDEGGEVNFRGFFGDYAVQVTAGGHTVSDSLTLTRDGQNECTLRLT